MDVKYNNLIAFYLMVAMFHAFILNILSINFPLFPFVSIITC